MAEKAGYRHFMLKEINEQPEAVDRTIHAHVVGDTGELLLPEANLSAARAALIQRVVLLSCGTSYHAALIGRSMIERLAGLTTEVDLASEFRYRDAILGPGTLVVAVSQSGRDRGHARGGARGRGARGPNARDHQRGGLGPRTRG